MVITFAQYSILVATREGATFGEIQQKTTFDASGVRCHLNGLLDHSFVDKAYHPGVDDNRFELTALGEDCLYAYEKANPTLIIRGLTYERAMA